jgi:predicted helicase
MTFDQILQKYRDISFSERDKGYRFEKLMKAYLQTDPIYAGLFDTIWLWNEFPSRADFGVGDKDLGIDLVGRTVTGDYWAIQCKCYKEDARIDKPKVDTFLSTSGKSFYDVHEAGKKVNFSFRLWIDTTINGFNNESKATIEGQTPPVGQIHYYDLVNAVVDWKKLDEGKKADVKKYDPKPHQQTAIDDVHNYLKNNDRGKLIMACGTGKTFTSLRIAEKETNEKGLVLFLVPSIALLGQTLREWKNQCVKPIHAICICSDAGVSKSNDNDYNISSTSDLALPASTSIKNIEKQFETARFLQSSEGGSIVVFSTYQSIEVISEVQKTINKKKKDSFLFDLVICDEAHRTTGVTLSGNDESAFVKIHDNDFIVSKKRIYMTATPRIYSEAAQKKAKEVSAEVCSMDDPMLYGEEMHRIGFGDAVSKKLLSDYKVIVLTVDENQLDENLKKSLKEKNDEIDKEISTDDTLKIIGCINALSKKSLTDKELFEGVDPTPMKSAVAFCQSIKISKATAEAFNVCKEIYFSTLTPEQRNEIVIVEADHVDGTMGAQQREKKLSWLKSADQSKKECNILHNVRCLSEGVDVPSLDAVMFLSARNSQIDVVQSVGRVMRTSLGKQYGYIIIPVVVPQEVEPEKVLSGDNFKAVWAVLNALRAHDERFDALINKIELNKKKPGQISVTGTNINGKDILGDPEITGTAKKIKTELEKQLELEFSKFQAMIYARIVKKCGTRLYWEEWAKDVAKIAENHIEQITAIIKKEGKAKVEFEKYISGLRKNINPSVTETEAVEMLAQHIITKPVFEALFDDYSFVKNNTVSKSLQGIIDALNEQTKKEDNKKLERFYISVKDSANNIDNSEAKQKIIVELYDKFFRTAFPKITEKLGIVYTPVEIVDFIIHSVEDVLQKEFGRSMTDENVHILDPFTGTGTFITRLLQSGIIRNGDLERKYTKEIHANEIVLLAYYIASINIENVYHDITGNSDDDKNTKLVVKNDKNFEYEKTKDGYGYSMAAEKNVDYGNNKTSVTYTPFPGICLTDTFQLGETKEGEELFSEIFPQNSERVIKQQKTPLRIIIGNPPYSRGQDSANDDAKNQFYPILEEKIKKTYSNNNSSGLVRDLYNSYIKAFRWSSDRIDNDYGGIIAFITNNGWLEKNFASGVRKAVEDEFNRIYIYDLKGEKNGLSRADCKRQGDNIFNIMTGVAITIFVKKPNSSSSAIVSHYSVDDYMTRNEKLSQLKDFNSLFEIKWNIIQSDIHGDWLYKRNDSFSNFIPLEPCKNNICFFIKNPVGNSTNRKDWVYNFSSEILGNNIKKMIKYYDLQRKQYLEKQIYDKDFTNIKWTENLVKDLIKNTSHFYKEDNFIDIQFSPFTKINLYNYKPFIERPSTWHEIIPNNDLDNLIIITPGISNRKDFCVLITDKISDLNNFDGGTQGFPLFWYEKIKKIQNNLFDKTEYDYVRHDGISDFILEQAKSLYGPKVSKEDIFYYVYGALHSPDYRKLFASNLKKMLPHLPLLEKVSFFWAFSKAGRELAYIHLNYEEQEPLKEILINDKPLLKCSFSDEQLYVEKMTFMKNNKNTIIFNSFITISNIPLKVYDYIINGQSAIECLFDSYSVTIDNKSGIRNDPNNWAKEHENPQYILDLLLSVITVSVKTMEIVEGLPKVEWE